MSLLKGTLHALNQELESIDSKFEVKGERASEAQAASAILIKGEEKMQSEADSIMQNPRKKSKKQKYLNPPPPQVLEEEERKDFVTPF